MTAVKRYILCGGSGLIGRALALELVNETHEVVMLSRNPEKLSGLPANVKAEKWDAVSGNDWYQVAEGCDAIVNLAGTNIGSGKWSAERKREIVKSRVDAGRAIVRAVELMKVKPRALVQASAVGYYGNSSAKQVNEESPPGNDFLARVAVDWEDSTKPIESMGVRRVIIRTGVVLSKNGGVFPTMVLPFRLFIGGRLGNGRQPFPWIHIDDEVRAVRFLIESDDAAGPFNLTAPHPVTNAQFSSILAEVIKRPNWLPVPAVALHLILGEMAVIALEGQNAVPNRLVEKGFIFKFPGARQAIEDLLR